MPEMYPKPNDFRPGARRISAESLNKLKRAIPPVFIGDGSEIKKIGNRIVVETSVDYQNNADQIQYFIVLGEYDDILQCVPYSYLGTNYPSDYDENTEVPILLDTPSTILEYDETLGSQILGTGNVGVIYVAKPTWFQRSLYENTTVPNSGKILHVDTGVRTLTTDDGTANHQTITPKYFPGEIIAAVLCNTGYYINDTPVSWIDINLTGRSWVSDNGLQLRITDGRLKNDKYDANLLVRDNTSKIWVSKDAVRVVDLSQSTSLVSGSDYLCHYNGEEASGEYFVSISTGGSLSDPTKWIPLISDPANVLDYTPDIVEAVDIADGDLVLVDGSSPTDFDSTLSINIIDSDDSIVAATVSIIGTAIDDSVISEFIDIGPGTLTYITVNKYKTVTSINVSAVTGAAPGDTIAVVITEYPVGILRDTYVSTVATSGVPGVSADWVEVDPLIDLGLYQTDTVYAIGNYVQSVVSTYSIQSGSSSDPVTGSIATDAGTATGPDYTFVGDGVDISATGTTVTFTVTAGSGSIITDPATGTASGLNYTFVNTAQSGLTISASGTSVIFNTAYSVGSAGSDFAIAWHSGSSTLRWNLPDASPITRGVITAGTQELAGLKTFDNTIVTKQQGTFGVSSVLSSGYVASSLDPVFPSNTGWADFSSSSGGAAFLIKGTTVYDDLETAFQQISLRGKKAVWDGASIVASGDLVLSAAVLAANGSTLAIDVTPSYAVFDGSIEYVGQWGTDPIGNVFSGGLCTTLGTGTPMTALTGDVTATGPGSATATIANDAVTYAKIQVVSASTLLGNPTGSPANVSEITLGTGLAFSGTDLICTVTPSGGDVISTESSNINGQVAVFGVSADGKHISINDGGIQIVSSMFLSSTGNATFGFNTTSSFKVEASSGGYDVRFSISSTGILIQANDPGGAIDPVIQLYSGSLAGTYTAQTTNVAGLQFLSGLLVDASGYSPSGDVISTETVNADGDIPVFNSSLDGKHISINGGAKVNLSNGLLQPSTMYATIGFEGTSYGNIRLEASDVSSNDTRFLVQSTGLFILAQNGFGTIDPVIQVRSATFGGATMTGYTGVVLGMNFASGLLVDTSGLAIDTATYTPTTPSDWSGTPPSTIREAIDRLAAWINANSTVFTALGITTQP